MPRLSRELSAGLDDSVAYNDEAHNRLEYASICIRMRAHSVVMCDVSVLRHDKLGSARSDAPSAANKQSRVRKHIIFQYILLMCDCPNHANERGIWNASAELRAVAMHMLFYFA